MAAVVGSADGLRAHPPRAARRAVMTVFACNGAGLATWFPHIPEVQRRLELSDGALGLALLGTPIGALVAMPTSSLLIARFGSRRVTLVAALTLFAALPLPAVAPHLPFLMLALALLGGANGVLDVAMNVQAVEVERAYRRPIMAAFHGVFSVGALIGGAVAVAAAALGIGMGAHMAGMAVILAAVVLRASLVLLPDRPTPAGEGGHGLTRPTRAVLVLGVISLCVFLGEGAMADWSAVYLRNTLNTGEGLAAAGYVVFSATMAIGRLTGDRMTAKIGPVAMLRYGGLIVVAGLTLALVSGWTAAALVGFACVGLGLAAGFPIALTAAGRVPNVAPGAALAQVTTVGYTGFLAGPPIIGFIAELSSLRLALGLVVLLGLVVAWLAPAVAHRSEQPVGT